ncbi:mechanosensitive ion channel family protein [Nitrospira lenta]|uniref:Putative Small-conductance mechanosensitive channel with cAMP-binding domain (Modular protein) n=1 Tax=Nitrospira lenta TaxID=1436998 RepID=A0A330L042_9BACT|nr:mechanosensitive ion channel family protein [Nitrospira lenta]SPP63100.1 putative Small-conductance mechanosensitive channel with cAMP-binding domain (Modular protein) [Nitrospira lenta]
MGVALILSLITGGLLVYLGTVRKKPAGLGFYVGCLSTIVLVLLLELITQGLIPHIPHWIRPWAAFLAYLAMSFVLLKTLDLLFIEDYLIEKRGKYIPRTLRLIFLLFGVTLAALILLRSVLDVDPLTLIALPTIATAVVGFALKDVIARLVSGIQLGRMIHVGDWVTLMDKEGMVTDIAFDYITIRTRAYDYIMLPNDAVSQTTITNHSRPESLCARAIHVDANYGHPPMQVKDILVQSALAVPGVVASPAPICFVEELKESGIGYQLKFFFHDYERCERLAGEVMAYVWYAFERNDIDIPYPQRVLHMTQPPDLTALRAAELAGFEEQFRAIDFLAILDAKALHSLAEQAHKRVYLPGEQVVREGESGDEFFVVVEGEADVAIKTGDHTTSVAVLKKGQFFGEMSLLTGAPRSATVQATSQLTVTVIGQQAMRQIISATPALAEQIGTILTARQSSLTATRETADRTVTRRSATEEGQSLTVKILQFFRRSGN